MTSCCRAGDFSPTSNIGVHDTDRCPWAGGVFLFARGIGGTVYGIEGHLVRVEVDISRGLPMFDIVGLPDASVRESRDRVRTALRNSGFGFPSGRIVVNLAPADLPKTGPACDLTIALSILAAEGHIPVDALHRFCIVGELSLDGTVRGVPGLLSIALAAREAGLAMLVAREAGPEAAIVPELPVTAVNTLKEAVARVRGEKATSEAPTPMLPRETTGYAAGDLSDVSGQYTAKRALEIAAAGGHNLLMTGPPGIGKTMLARRMVTIMPPLSRAEYLQVCRVYSAAGLLSAEPVRSGQRPFRAPHHSATRAGLLGGARGIPGEVSLADHGVLFLDELNEFPRAILESLRQPLEDAEVVLARLPRPIRFPARFTLVAAANPCPCGYLGDTRRECRCSDRAVQAYRNKLSGPLMDRIDLHVELTAPTWTELKSRSQTPESETVRARVTEARAVQSRRFAGTPELTNGRMGTADVRRFCRLDAAAESVLRMAVEQLSISARAVDRTLKVARTIADLSGSERITRVHLQEALMFRTPSADSWVSGLDHMHSPSAGGVSR